MPVAVIYIYIFIGIVPFSNRISAVLSFRRACTAERNASTCTVRGGCIGWLTYEPNGVCFLLMQSWFYIVFVHLTLRACDKACDVCV